MKILITFCAVMLMTSSSIMASEKLDLKTIANGDLSADYISGIVPLEGSDQYSQISSDKKQIVNIRLKLESRRVSCLM